MKTKPTPEEYQRRFNALREGYLERVRAIAAEIREDVIVPFCEENQIGFDFQFRWKNPHKRFPDGSSAKNFRDEVFKLKPGDDWYDLYTALFDIGEYLNIGIGEERSDDNTGSSRTVRDFIEKVDPPK